MPKEKVTQAYHKRILVQWGIVERIERENRARLAKYLNFIVGLLNYCNHLRHIYAKCVQIAIAKR